MKKTLAFILAVIMLFALSACGAKPDADAKQDTSADSAASSVDVSANGADDSEPADTSEQDGGAEAGTVSISLADAAIVVDGNTVKMPYKMDELASAGVPIDDWYYDLEIGAGEFYNLNFYLDANEDYVVMPAYYNGTSDTISVADAEANEITMSCYSDDPTDQGVSILGVKFGMAKSDVAAMFGEPTWDDGDSLQWDVTVSDADYEGSLSIYFTSSDDSAGASHVTLSLTAE